jgi:general secretion pathway protein D
MKQVKRSLFKKYWFTFFLSQIFFGFLGLPSSSLYAQFSSRSPAENGEEPIQNGSTEEELEDLSPPMEQNIEESVTREDQQFFGRSSSGSFSGGALNSSSSKGNQEQKYVNLNPETAFGPEVITSFDFPNADIMDLTKHMQKLTGINLILDKEVKGKISIMAPTPITVGDAWKAYLTALNLNGLTLVKSGAFYKIINSRDIRYTPSSIYTGQYTPDTENYVMRIISLKNVSSAEISRSFRPFMSRFGRIIDIKQTNTVIIHDTGMNINRLMKLIKFLDVPGHDETLQIIKVQHSSAQEIAGLLDKILKGQGANRFRNASSSRDAINVSKIIAEPRTNSIIAMANSDGAKQLRELIAKLDVKMTQSRDGQIHVYYLNYGDSETLSKTLSSLVSSSMSNRSRLSPRIDGGRSELFANEVKITSDKSNNALVVMASPTDYLTIKRIISKLDIPRDQVYVEGMIMETQVNDGHSFGVSILGAYGTGNAQRAGFAPSGSQDLVSLLTNNITNLSGLFIGGGAGKKISYTQGGQTVTINSVNALIKAIATDNQTNVLATPQILALDNEEAVFEVGETVPTLIRETAANGSSITSVKEQKVALTLKITPQINKVTRVIKLKINHKIDDFSDRATGAGEGVGTTTRQAVTTVLIRDRDTLAMGGLMRDKNVMTESKVPLLGDIPVLGWLFKQKSKSTSKVNLLFFLTPKILVPYEKTAATHLKDLINRRSAHLKDVYGDKDPFNVTMKGLYDKAKKQEEGPLFDQQHVEMYKKENENSSGVDPSEATKQEELLDPKYQDVLQTLEQKQNPNAPTLQTKTEPLPVSSPEKNASSPASATSPETTNSAPTADGEPSIVPEADSSEQPHAELADDPLAGEPIIDLTQDGGNDGGE